METGGFGTAKLSNILFKTDFTTGTGSLGLEAVANTGITRLADVILQQPYIIKFSLN
jgi:hypothetical protein